MHRRQFITLASSFLACTCCGVRVSLAAALSGCSLALRAGDLKNLRDSSGIAVALDSACLKKADELTELYGVRAALMFFDEEGASNAFAAPKVTRDGYPDGTVFLGTKLLSEFRSLGVWASFAGEMTNAIEIVMAHEFAHILQYKKKVKSAWEMEPHADFMAGWAEGRHDANTGLGGPNDPYRFSGGNEDFIVEQANTMFGFGDTDFNDKDHHGEPHYRSVMVRAGYESASLGVQEAFAKGATWARLKV